MRFIVQDFRAVPVDLVPTLTFHQVDAPERIYRFYREVIIRGAKSFALCHNHPSGDSSPSSADEITTRRIRGASEIFQIVLLDHVIIRRPSPERTPYFFFRVAGLL